MTISQKFFAENVTLTAATPTSMATLLHAAGFGFERDLTTNTISTTPSLDSFSGVQASILPAGDVYVGHDQFVSNAAAAGPPRLYKGALAAATLKFSVESFCRGIVDPGEVWFYSVGGTTMDLVFKSF